MIKKEMSIETDPLPALSFSPLPGMAFGEARVPIPDLPNYDTEAQLRVQATEKIREACSNTECMGRVTLSSADRIGNQAGRVIVGATIVCSLDSCPLRGPGESGDREPLQPAPKAPSINSESTLAGGF